MAKTKDAGAVYQLKITLRDIKPTVWRRVQVKDCTLAKLHDIIQTCLGWEGYHLHAFEVGGEQYGEPDPDGMMEDRDSRRMKLSQVGHRLTGRGTGLTLGGSVPTGRLWHNLRKGKGLWRRTPRGQVSTPYTALFTTP
jgi:hypothetical protein